ELEALRDTRVLGELLGGVHVEPRMALAQLHEHIQAPLQALGALAELAAAAREIPDSRVELCRVRVPRLRRRVQVGEVPPVGRGLRAERCAADEERHHDYESRHYFASGSGRTCSL